MEPHGSGRPYWRVFSFILILALFLVGLLHHGSHIIHSYRIAELKQVGSVVKTTNSTLHPPQNVTRCHVFMGVALPNKENCYPLLGDELSRKARRVFPMVNVSMVIFNRVLKCGSSTVNTVTRNLAEKNKYTRVHSRIYDNHELKSKEQVWHQ